VIELKNFGLLGWVELV